MNLSSINWIAPPQQHRIQVYRPRQEDTLRVIAAGPALALHMHRSPSGCVPCCCWPAPDRICRAEGALVVTYIPAVLPDSKRLVLELPDVLPGLEPPLTAAEVTGLWLKVKRLPVPHQDLSQVNILVNLFRATNVVPFDPLPRLLVVWASRMKGARDPDDQAAMLDQMEGGQPS